jgi:outer membrane immunogenic protein
MKKAACLALVLLMIVAGGAASLRAGAMTFGVKGGLSVAKLTGSDVEGMDWRTAGVGGLFFCYHINDVVAVQPEALYAMKGATQDTTVYVGLTPVTIKGTLKLDYFQIPLLLKVYVPTEGKIKPHIFAGPAIAFNVKHKLREEALEVAAEADVENIKSTDFGIVAGAGFEYRLSSGCILFDARYEAGLTSIDDSGFDADVKNSAVSIMVGYGFAF